MLCGEMAALSARLTVPLDSWSLMGAKVKVTAQVAPGATEPQLCAAVTVDADEVNELKLSGALPQFVTLSVCCAELKAFVCGKATLQAAGQKEGAAVAMLSLETKVWT